MLSDDNNPLFRRAFVYRIQWDRKKENIYVNETLDLTKGKAVIFDKAIWAFDVLIIEHGFSYDYLMELWDDTLTKYREMGLSLKDAEMQSWLFFIRLRMRLRRNTILKTGKRKTKEELNSTILELRKFYAKEQAQYLIEYYFKNRKRKKTKTKKGDN